MKIELVLPQMGESITEGTVSKWLKRPGEKVEKDESVLEVTTDKIDTEIPAPESGVLGEILVQEGQTVPVGTVLAYLETKEEPAAPPSTKGGKTPPAEEEEPPQGPATAPSRISPVARKMAEEEGLGPEELERIQGSGVGGRITKSDLLGFLRQRETAGPGPAREKEEKLPPVPPPPQEPSWEFSYDRERVEVIPMTPMRKKIAEHMVYSKRTSPHVYTVAEVDMGRVEGIRKQHKLRFQKEEGFKLTYTPFVLQATVRALKKWPLLNASVEGDQIIRKHYINLGVAVAVEEGLLVPVIRDADQKNLLGLARAVHDLSTRARNKRLKPEELQDGTFTVTNPGVFGSILSFPIINQPQVGILGVAAVKKRVVVVDEEAMAIRPLMNITLSYDHRIIDGATAGRFLQEIARYLEEFQEEDAF